MNIEELINQNRIQLMKDKEFFWNHPELGFEEFETSRYIVRRLEEIGFTEIHKEIAKTGVMAILKSEEQGPCILLRADMDAVSVSENIVKHTCGHDAHMAILLTIAKLIYENKENLKGTVKILFQPAEDGMGGAKPMVDAGVMENPKVDKVFGLHVWSEIDLGKVAVKEGPIMASTDPFEIEILGRGGHAAIPEKCIDPIYISSKIIEGFKELSDRYNINEKNIVLGITSIHGGSTTNVIPEKVSMKGIFRTFDNDSRKVIKKQLQEIIKNVAEKYDAKINLQHIEERPVVVNSKEDSIIVKEIVEQIVGKDNVIVDYKTMCSEDFSFYLEKAPGVFVFVGCMKDIYYPQHNENFKVDEDAVVLGAQVLYNIVKKYVF